MELGMIGLGRMGGNMVQRLLQGGHRIMAYDANAEAIQTVVQQGAVSAASIADLATQLTVPRAAWVMVPSGKPTEGTINALAGALSPGDTIIDGGNANYKDSMRRATALNERGIAFLDAGTSGGIWGLKEGYSLMVGGDAEAFKRLEPIFQTLAPAPDRGYGRVGPAGAGHFVKMVHNGIEYGLMQAYAEGFELMEAKSEFSPRPGPDCRGMATRQRGALLATGSDGGGSTGGPNPGGSSTACRRLRRGTLDSPGVHRSGSASAGHYPRPTSTVPLPSGPALRAQAAGGHAQPVWWSCGQKGGVMAVGTTTIVIYGASGDLVQRKLMPALFNLQCKGPIAGGPAHSRPFSHGVQR